MLRIIQNNNVPGAKSYYSTSDYYSEGQELVGIWRGNGAERLGLSGEISKPDWDALCDNRNPATGRVLTPRQKDGRRVGYDFNFHVPKSLSLLYGLTGDERVLAAFRAAVNETMQDIESEMQTRVRSGGRNEDRTTGNMVWGEFVHSTARPVDGLPDPHLHAHCFVFNTTWDPEESRWKAGQFAGLKRDAPYFEALFHSRLAEGLKELGLEVERTKKGWELAGISSATIRAFSRRTVLIENLARELGVVDPVAKDELGAKTRQRKCNALTMDQLRQEWQARLPSADRDSLERLVSRVGGQALPADPARTQEAVQEAFGHCFERSAVVPERSLMTTALRRSFGLAGPEEVSAVVGAQPLLRAERDGRRLATTPAVLKEEQKLIAFARNGRGTQAPLNPEPWIVHRTWLNAGQRRAVEHVLRSPDRVVLIRGAAGVGKTAMMQEAVEGVQAMGHSVFVFAPSADASRGVLREQEGFREADTVARLLVDQELQERVRGEVMWIDEAGLLGSKDMARVFHLADKLGARVILSGDRRQHGSVERGAALRLLEDEAGLVPAEIKEIQRQRGDYKTAIAALAAGDIARGFRKLDQLGWVRELPEGERYLAMAKDYVAAVKEGKSALVVSPTHREGERIGQEIRTALQHAGVVDLKEHTLKTLTNLNLTAAERRDSVNYQEGDTLVFHQNAKGYRKSQRVKVDGSVLPLDQAERFQVFRSGSLQVAAGDVLRITRNGTTADGRHRLNNGALVKVKGFTNHGDMVLANGWTVAKDYGHIAHGYVVTSHASQGKTVDRVLIGQSSSSAPAASPEQFYVSASRGRERATIYTDDKHALLEAISRPEDRLTATDLARARDAKRYRTARRNLAQRKQGRTMEVTPELEADRA